jgi:hypothetical protein
VGASLSFRVSSAIEPSTLMNCCRGTGGRGLQPWYRLPPDMQVNKVSHVRTIDLVAKDLGEDVCFLFDVAIQMEPEDGLIWVRGLGEESVMAFTDHGVDSLVELIKIHREMMPREER